MSHKPEWVLKRLIKERRVGYTVRQPNVVLLLKLVKKRKLEGMFFISYK